ncbi:MAG: chorismate synthase [Candidatus Pacebacteria bacterium]|nr:chorismate synthase [Candidatus Paceibacterota bacterium]
MAKQQAPVIVRSGRDPVGVSASLILTTGKHPSSLTKCTGHIGRSIMLGCSYGRMFQVAVGGGSYQSGLLAHIQGVPPGLYFEEQEIYAELLQRKPGQGELSSPRREPDIPIIYTGTNAADTMKGVKNEGYTNGTPLTILIPNLDRHFEHIEQYRVTNRTPRPGHASYATYQKYGKWDDAIGAGIFSGRYTSTIVAAGAVARRVLKDHGIDIFSFVKEAAGIRMPNLPYDQIKQKVNAFKLFRRDSDPVYNLVYKEQRITPDMRFLQKLAVLADIEKMVPDITRKPLTDKELSELEEKGLHPVLNCPDLEAARAMHDKILQIRDQGDSSGGIVEVVATGVPPGLGEPVFAKLDGELGRMLSIGTIKAIEIGAGMHVKDMTGSQCNDQIRVKNGEVTFSHNNNGGVTGGVTTGQDIVARLAVKPTPTIAKPQQTIDKVTLNNAELAAVTRRDPTIVSRVWPVAEAFTAIILLDQIMMHKGYQAMAECYR